MPVPQTVNFLVEVEQAGKPVHNRTIAVTNSTLSTLIEELGSECQNVITLYQFRLDWND
jgi:hypothetical protein